MLLQYNATLCRSWARNLQVLRTLKTTVPSQSTKTPIQEWGWDYLLRQRQLKRPISPHLNVYKPQLTWMVSGFHRMTGCAMAGALLIGGAGFALLPLNFTTFIDFVRGLGLPWFVYDSLKFIIAYPIAFHSLNGIRFIAFDMAKGTGIESVYKSGYLVLSLAALIALAVVVAPRMKKPNYVVVETMSAVEVVSRSEEPDGNSISSEPTKYLEEIHALQNYVADYIQYRIHLYGGHVPQLPEFPVQNDRRYELIRAVALKFEKKYSLELMNMVRALCHSGGLTFQRYVEVVESFACGNDDEPSEQLSYGRLTALIAFAGLFATRLCDMQQFSEVSLITQYTSKFLQKRVALTWTQNGRSWEQFFERIEEIMELDSIEENERIKPKMYWNSWWPSVGTLVVFGILGICTITIMRNCSSRFTKFSFI